MKIAMRNEQNERKNVKKILAAMMIFIMLCTLCACENDNAQSQMPPDTKENFDVQDNSNSDDMQQNSEFDADDNDDYVDEGIAELCVEFTDEYVNSTADEFARLMATCKFDSAEKYLHKDLHKALNDDVTYKNLEQRIYGIPERFDKGVAGISPEYSEVWNSQNVKANIWEMKMEDLKDHHDKLGIEIDFDSDGVVIYNYSLGKVCDGINKYTLLTVYVQNDEVLHFNYVGTN